VGSFGLITESKAPERVIAAFAGLPHEMQGELGFTGYVDSELRGKLKKLARDYQMRGRLRFHGRADDSKWKRILSETTCAVQLRARSNGESSAAVNDCLAMGVPVITNIEACRELPEGTVVCLPSDPSVTDVRDALAALLGSRDRRESLRKGGLSHVDKISFQAVAKRLLERLQQGTAFAVP
jgi:glycosyltransferase involved in cell wall biosynthesis